MTKSLMNAASALAAALAIAAPVAAQAAGLDAVSFRSTQASLDRVQTAGGLVLDPNPPSGQPPAIIGLARSTGTLRREHGQVSFQGSSRRLAERQRLYGLVVHLQPAEPMR